MPCEREIAAVSSAGALRLLLVADAAWCCDDSKRLGKGQIPISDRRTVIATPAADVSVKFRTKAGNLRLDSEAHLHISRPGKVALHSMALARELAVRSGDKPLLLLLLEQADEILRVTAHFMSVASMKAFMEERPQLRLEAMGIPPSTILEFEPTYSRDGMDADGAFEALLSRIQAEDGALFATHTEHFLSAPHIIVPLITHLSSLSAEENLKFPVQLKRIADQFRSILAMDESPLRIHKIEHNHLDTWADADGKRFAYLDGGVARIAGLPGQSPTAIRVGIYSVRAGDTSLETREGWDLQPFVVGDLIDKNTGVRMPEDDQIDLRRLGEAARYTLEALTGLRFLEANTNVDTLYCQGPLINQFVMYDEGEPHYIPFLREDFLTRVGITQEEVERLVTDIPARDGQRMWRQFMAIYGYIAARVYGHSVPILGVVERSAGSWLAGAVLDAAVGARIVNQSYRLKVIALLKKYGISDDFLFGCVLAAGEYITPVTIPKNQETRARPIWHSVVRNYPKPYATVLKTTDVSFPFRVEMNRAAQVDEKRIMRQLYHTARLLPRYAFPAGLDIVDKYAKVPDWLSRNVSARLAAAVLNRAMAEGDPRLIVQVRQLLAHTPRDFFYRPTN